MGDNRYQPTVELRITGAGGLNQEYLLQGDVDGDGQKELVLSTGNVVMVLKAVGDDAYEVYWLKRFPDEASVQVGDIDGLGGLDLTVSFTFRIQTEVYVSRLPTKVEARDVEVLANRWYASGEHQVRWEGWDEAPATGIYPCRLEIGGEVQTRKLVLVR